MVWPTLDGTPLQANPTDIRWNFSMKAKDTKTMGGKVIQILGTTLSDITIDGQFGVRRDLGYKEAWEDELRFRNQVDKRWADKTATQEKAVPLRFVYAPRKWDFQVFISSYSSTSHTIDAVSPTWRMTLFPVDEGALKVAKGVKDLYIARLMDGVGWKQSDYNGPTQAEVDAKLDPFGGSVPDYMRDRMSTAFTEGIDAVRSNPNTGEPQ